MTNNFNFVPGQRIKLSTHINELVRFKLHEVADMKEGVIRAIDQYAIGLKAVRSPSTYGASRRVLTLTPKSNSLNSSAFTGCRERKESQLA